MQVTVLLMAVPHQRAALQKVRPKGCTVGVDYVGLMFFVYNDPGDRTRTFP